MAAGYFEPASRPSGPRFELSSAPSEASRIRHCGGARAGLSYLSIFASPAPRSDYLRSLPQFARVGAGFYGASA